MTDLIHIRDIFTLKMTFGYLQYKGVPLLLNGQKIYIGEDVARPDSVKIFKETAISAGDCFISITFSNRFQRMMPLIYNQDNLSYRNGSVFWTGIRQHNGNTEADTDACQLLGLGRNLGGVYSSHAALDLYYPFIEKLVADAGGKIPYRIVNQQAA